MKEYLAKDVRNVVLLGHSGAGKTALVESALFQTKAIDRMGKTTDGTATMDFDPEEAKRGVSVYTAVAYAVGWFGGAATFTQGLIIAGIQLAVAFVIWFCFMRYYKKEAKRMNEKIQAMKQ